MGSNSQAGIQHQNTLLCPRGQKSVLRRIEVWIVNFQSFVHILERRRGGSGRIHAKSKSMCLIIIVIRVLS